MVFPLGIDDVEDDAALKPAHHGRAEERFLLFVALLDFFDQGSRQLVVGQCWRDRVPRLWCRCRIGPGLRRRTA